MGTPRHWIVPVLAMVGVVLLIHTWAFHSWKLPEIKPASSTKRPEFPELIPNTIWPAIGGAAVKNGAVKLASWLSTSATGALISIKNGQVEFSLHCVKRFELVQIFEWLDAVRTYEYDFWINFVLSSLRHLLVKQNIIAPDSIEAQALNVMSHPHVGILFRNSVAVLIISFIFFAGVNWCILPFFRLLRNVWATHYYGVADYDRLADIVAQMVDLLETVLPPPQNLLALIECLRWCLEPPSPLILVVARCAIFLEWFLLQLTPSGLILGVFGILDYFHTAQAALAASQHFNDQSSYTPVSLPQDYCLQGLEFLSRISLLRSLAAQIRLVPFCGTFLTKNLLQVSEEMSWTDREEFLHCSEEVSNFSDQFEFMNWLLKWRVSSEELQNLINDHAAKALAMKTPAKTYSEVLDILRVLDTLPYLHFQFQEVFNTLTKTGALSHPAVAGPLRIIFHTRNSYFQFFTLIDYDCWTLFEGLPGRPARSSQLHSLRSGIVRPDKIIPMDLSTLQLAQLLDKVTQMGYDPSPDRYSYYAPVYVGSNKLASFAYWDQDSSQSYVSTALVKSLSLAPITAGQSASNQLIASLSQTDSTQYLNVQFNVSTFEQTFTYTFIIADLCHAPLVLGSDFWAAYESF